jgi:riboflavin kinase/FMN adenylyltransferase
LNTATAIKNSTTIAIGGFDGMHIGHQKLFEALGENGCIVVIETGYANLTPKKQRQHFTHHAIIYLDLDEIRHLDGEEFISFLKEKFPNLKKIVVGYDFHFGKNRKYSFDDLKKIFDGEVEVIGEVTLGGDSVHSHKIRAKLGIGDIKGANAFLGHNYTIEGTLEKGQGIGKKELVATINISAHDYLVPKEGVYVSLTRVDDEEHYHPSVSFVGHRETTDGSFAIESHILDGEVLCREKAAISFVDFIRENKKFNSIDELKKAIKKDIAIASKELRLLQL